MKSLVNICLEYLLNEWVYTKFNVHHTNKMHLWSWKMPIDDKFYHLISKYDIYHETSLPLFANAWSMLRSFPSLFADLPSKRASKYSDSENIFHVFVHSYLYKFSLAFISSWESNNVTLFIFWNWIMKMGFKMKQNDTWHLFKTRAIGNSWNR